MKESVRARQEDIEAQRQLEEDEAEAAADEERKQVQEFEEEEYKRWEGLISITRTK